MALHFKRLINSVRAAYGVLTLLRDGSTQDRGLVSSIIVAISYRATTNDDNSSAATCLLPYPRSSDSFRD